MKKQSKFKLSIVMATLSFASVLAAGSAVISCGNTSTSDGSTSSSASIQAVYSKNQFVRTINSQKSVQAFDYDASRSYGSFQGAAYGQMVDGTTLREKYDGQTETTSILVKDSESTTPKPVQIILQPTYRSLKFILAKAFVLTFADGTTKVYDNDKAEVLPQAKSVDYTLSDGTKKTYKVFDKVTEDKTSNDPKSINNPQFLLDLQKANKLQIVLKPDLYWVNYKGEKTKYQIVPKDFYYSWLRTQSINNEFRTDHGGSAELNNLANSICEKNSSSFTNDESYQNEYIYNIYDIDSSKFYDESKFITPVTTNEDSLKGQEAITFDAESSVKSAKFDKLLTMLYSDYTFMPAPSQYIDDMNKNPNNIPVLSYNNEQNDQTKALKADIEKMSKDSIMYKIGAYWYGIGSENTLYSGPYYPVPTTDLSVVLQKNKYYADKDFVDSQDTVNQVINSYLQKAEAPADFNKRLWNYYQQGTTSLTPYSQLSDTAKQDVAKNPVEYGLRFIQILNKNTNVGMMVQSPFVNRAPGKDINNYGFNDAYAKMMWGATREQINEGKYDPNVYINGTGLSFRTLLNAAINWSEYVKQTTSDQNKVWLAKLAPNSQIGYKDDTANDQPVDYYEQVNSLFAIAKDGNKVNFSSEANKPDYLITPSENIEENVNKNDVETKLESVGFNVLKEKMSELIAKFDQENPDLKGQPFVFHYFYPYTNPPQTLVDTVKRLSKIASELNPRIQIDMKYFDNPDSNPDYNNYKLKGANGTQAIGWTYDYDGIGSGYDAYSWGLKFIPTLVQIATSKNDTVIQKQFPEIYKLANALMEYEKGDSAKGIEAHPFKTSVPFDEINKVSNSVSVANYAIALQYYVLEKDPQTGLYSLKRDQNNKPVKATEEYSDLYAYSSKFWLYYIGTLTKDEVVNLMQQMTNFMGISFPYGTSISKEKFARALINEHYIYPSQLGEDWTQYQDIRIKEK